MQNRLLLAGGYQLAEVSRADDVEHDVRRGQGDGEGGELLALAGAARDGWRSP